MVSVTGDYDSLTMTNKMLHEMLNLNGNEYQKKSKDTNNKRMSIAL